MYYFHHVAIIYWKYFRKFSDCYLVTSVSQFSGSVMSDSLRPRESQHACCCLEDKIRTGSPLLNKEDDKKLKELKQKYRNEGY